MSANGDPPGREQAEQIMEQLRADNIDVPDDLTVDEIEDSIDPEKPMPVNYSSVVDDLHQLP